MSTKDLKVLTKDALIYGIGNASNRIIQVILAPLYAAYLSADRFGIRSLTIALYGILQIIIVMALDQGVIADYYEVKTEKERRTVISTGFTFSVISSIIVGGIFFFLAAPVARIMGIASSEGTYIMKLFSLYTILTPPMFVFLSFLRSEKKPVQYSLYTILTSLARVGLMFVFLVVLKRELVGVFEVDTIVSLAVFPVLIISVYMYTKGIKFSFKSLKSMLWYSLPLIPTAGFVWIRNLSDRFLIKVFLTQTDVGIFSFAVNFPNVLSFLLVVPLALAWVPYAFSKKDDPELPSFISRILTYFLLLAGWALIVLGGSSYEILHLIAKRPEYWQGVWLVPFLVLGICIYGAYYIIATPCNLHRRTIFFTISTLISAVVTLIANVVLLPTIGLIGSAVASLISYLGMFVPMFFFSKKLMPIPYESKRILIISASSIIMTAIFFLWQPAILDLFSANGLVSLSYPKSIVTCLIIKILAGSIFYFLLLLIFGFLKSEERRIIKRLLSLKKTNSD